MNYYSIYETIIERKQNDKVALKKLVELIKKNNQLLIQHNIFENLLKKSSNTDDCINQISLIENYCKNLNYEKINESNKNLLNYFNINPKEVKKNKVYQAIDNLIKFNSGGLVNFNEAKKYRKIILENNDKIQTEMATFKVLNKETTAEVAKKYAKELCENLDLDEIKLLESLLGNKKILHNKIKLIEKKSLFLDERAKKINEANVLKLKNKLKENKSNNVAFEIFSLLNETKTLLENKYGPGTEKRLSSLDLVKDIVVSCTEGKNKPSQIIIDFNIYYTPSAKGVNEILAEAKDFEKKIHVLSKSIIRDLLRSEKNKKYFSNDFIFDSTIPTTGLKYGKKYKCMLELYLDTNQTDEKKFEEFLRPAVDLLNAYEIKLKSSNISTYLTK